jgi:hypothetical protein
MRRHTTQAGPGSEFFTLTEFIQPPVAKESLVAWYPFRSGTGEDITAGDSNFGDTTDYSTSVNGATFQSSGGVTDIQTGPNSGAFAFDGVDDGLIHNISGQIVFDNSVTAMLWVKNRAPMSEVRLAFSLPRFAGSGDRAVGLFTSNGDFVGHVDDGSTGVFPGESVTDTFASDFHHYAVRYDGSAATLHIDGQQVASKSANITDLRSDDTIRVGNSNSATAVGNGDIVADGFRLYNSSLTDSQINQVYLNTEP